MKMFNVIGHAIDSSARQPLFEQLESRRLLSAAIFIDAGAPGADVNFSGGKALSVKATKKIATGGVTTSATKQDYRTERYGNFTYNIPGLTPHKRYSVRLDFAELVFNTPKARKFNVSINKEKVLSNFDIYRSAGGKNKAISGNFTAVANTHGRIVMAFKSIKGGAAVNAIEISPAAIGESKAPLSIAAIGNATIKEGDQFVTPFAVTGSFSDGASDSVTGTVDYGDGSAVQTLTIDQAHKAFPLAHTYDTTLGKTFTVKVTLQDSAGNSATTATKVITVNDPPKNLPVQSTYNIPVGGSVALTGHFGDNGGGAGDTYSEAVNWGDGSAVETFTETDNVIGGLHTYKAAGVYTLKYTVTDAAGASTSATSNVTVANAISIAPISTATIKEGQQYVTPYSTNGSFTANSGNGPFTGTVDYGDGSGSQALSIDQSHHTFPLAHTYDTTLGKTYTLTVTIHDNIGNSATGTGQVKTINDPPTNLPIASSYNIAAGGMVTVQGHFSDNGGGSGDVYQELINWGDGSAAESFQETENIIGGAHTYNTKGVYTLKYTVTDAAGATTTATSKVTVA